jgi:acyl-CoA thioesterase-1
MKSRIHVLIASSILLLSCASDPTAVEPGEQSAPATNQQPIAAAPDPRPVIVAFGDSLSAGYGVEEGLSYPDYLQKALDAAGYDYRVVNAGLSGDTTSGGRTRVATIADMRPAMVILELGGNDGLRGLPIEATRANLEEMIVRLRESGTLVVLAGMSLPPNYGPDYIAGFEKIYSDLAAAHELPLIPFLLEGVGGHPELMQNDSIHPTAEGNRIVAGNVMTVIAPLLNKKSP